MVFALIGHFLVFNLLTFLALSFEIEVLTDLFPVFELADINFGSCPAYTCKQSNQDFSPETCVYFDSPTSTYYGKKCSDKTKICSKLKDQNSTCVIKPVISNNKWPGERCSTSNDCSIYGPSCTNNTCQGSEKNETCLDDNYCNPGLKCEYSMGQGKCTPQILFDEKGCDNDYDCVNGAGCMISVDPQNNTCVPYFSLPPGSSIYQCAEGYSNLCSSGTCTLKNEADPDEYACTILLKNPNSIPDSCSLVDPCFSTADDFFTPGYKISSPCSCAWNINRTSYCDLFPGDAPYLQYTAHHLKWLKSPAINSCNTIRREASECISDY